MKAWMIRSDGFIGAYLIHGDTRGKAKYAALHHTEVGEYDLEFIELRVTRCSQLDNLPLTIEHVEKVLDFPDAVDEDGHPYTGEYCTREDYRNQCPCPLCKL